MHAEDRVTTTLADVKAYCLCHCNSLAIGAKMLRNAEGFGLGVRDAPRTSLDRTVIPEDKAATIRGIEMKLQLSSVFLVCAGLLAFGVLPLPYGYYQALRAVVFLIAGFAAFFEWDRNKAATGWVYVLACMAVLWNPFFPVHLSKAVWIIFDLAGAAIMYAYWREMTKKSGHETE